MIFVVQLISIAFVLLEIYLFVKSNLMIMRLVNLTAMGKFQLWTGNINTGQLRIADKDVQKVLHEKLVVAIVLYKRAVLLIYVCALINLAIFWLGRFI
jgi:hypothetical protein